MNDKSLVIIGVVLTATCGSIIGRKIGYEGFDQAFVAGFAIGIALLGQIRAITLRKRIVDLEAKVKMLDRPAA